MTTRHSSKKRISKPSNAFTRKMKTTYLILAFIQRNSDRSSPLNNGTKLKSLILLIFKRLIPQHRWVFKPSSALVQNAFLSSEIAASSSFSLKFQVLFQSQFNTDLLDTIYKLCITHCLLLKHISSTQSYRKIFKKISLLNLNYYLNLDFRQAPPP